MKTKKVVQGLSPIAVQTARATRAILRIFKNILKLFTTTSFLPQLVVLFILYKFIQYQPDQNSSENDDRKKLPSEKRNLQQSFTEDADMSFVIFQQAKMSAELQKEGLIRKSYLSLIIYP